MILEITSPLLYRVRLTMSGHEALRHTDQLKSATPHPSDDLVYMPFLILTPQHHNFITDAATLLSTPFSMHVRTIVAPPVIITSPPMIDDIHLKCLFLLCEIQLVWS